MRASGLSLWCSFLCLHPASGYFPWLCLSTPIVSAATTPIHLLTALRTNSKTLLWAPDFSISVCQLDITSNANIQNKAVHLPSTPHQISSSVLLISLNGTSIAPIALATNLAAASVPLSPPPPQFTNPSSSPLSLTF